MTSGQEYVGLSEVDAERKAERAGLFIEVWRRNHLDLTAMRTDDYLAQRVRVHVQGGQIVAAERG